MNRVGIKAGVKVRVRFKVYGKLYLWAMELWEMQIMGNVL